MAIKERGENIFQVRVYIGRDSITKKRIEVNETVYGDRNAAEKREQLLKTQARGGNLVKSSSMTVTQMIKIYLDSARNHLSKNTIRTRKDQYKRYVIPFIGDIQIRKIKRSDIQRLLNHLLDPKKQKKVND